MKSVILILILSMFFVLSGCGGDDSPTASAGTSIKGKVLVKATQAPVSGAKISFGDMVTTSDAGGNYTIANVPKVKQALKAETSNYAVYIEAFTAVSGENIKDIELETFSEYCTRVTSVVYQGKTYNTVLIDNQCWFKENLNTGNKLEISAEPTNNGVIEKYCYNGNVSNCEVYGALYKWDEAMQYVISSKQGICPDGWHIPTSTDLTTLLDFVDGNSLVLKDTTEGSWNLEKPEGIGNNSSGFSAKGAGFVGFENGNLHYFYFGEWGDFWSSTELNDDEAYSLGVFDWSANTLFGGADKTSGFSIRCLKD